MGSLFPGQPDHAGLQLHESRIYADKLKENIYDDGLCPVPAEDGLESVDDYFHGQGEKRWEGFSSAVELPGREIERPRRRCGLQNRWFWVVIAVIIIIVGVGAGIGIWLGLSKHHEHQR